MRRLLLIAFLFLGASAQNQAQSIDSAISAGHCDQVIDQLKSGYEASPSSIFAYTKYLHCLFDLNEKKKVKRLIEDFSEQSKSNLIQWDKMAYVIVFENDNSLLQDRSFLMNTMEVNAATSRWEYLGLDDLALEAMERSVSATGNASAFGDRYTRALEKENQVEDLIPIYLRELQQADAYNLDKSSIESKILKLMDDEDNLDKARKFITKEIEKNPNNTQLTKLLFWIYESKGQWVEASEVAWSLESKNRAQGKYIDELISDAIAAEKYDIVVPIYDRLQKSYADDPLGDRIFMEKLGFMQSYYDSMLTTEYVSSIKSEADSIFWNSDYWNSSYLFTYTDLYYRYLDDPYYAIDILEYNLDDNRFRSGQKALVELKLGDYLGQIGQRWDALLYYSRVEKSQKENPIGEEARFRNAKLSYYFGDFEWAKDQLQILKTATQEYIANDALELWLRIVDNTPSDSNFVPMQKLARAEWHIWQKQYDSAEYILNLIGIESSKEDPIMADVYLLSAEVDHHLGDAASERKNLNKIISDYSDDILADDAYYRLALLDISEGKKEDALLILKQFLIKFDNSPLITDVRKLMEKYFSDVL